MPRGLAALILSYENQILLYHAGDKSLLDVDAEVHVRVRELVIRDRYSRALLLHGFMGHKPD